MANTSEKNAKKDPDTVIFFPRDTLGQFKLFKLVSGHRMLVQVQFLEQSKM